MFESLRYTAMTTKSFRKQSETRKNTHYFSLLQKCTSHVHPDSDTDPEIESTQFK